MWYLCSQFAYSIFFGILFIFWSFCAACTWSIFFVNSSIAWRILKYFHLYFILVFFFFKIGFLLFSFYNLHSLFPSFISFLFLFHYIITADILLYIICIILGVFHILSVKIYMWVNSPGHHSQFIWDYFFLFF